MNTQLLMHEPLQRSNSACNLEQRYFFKSAGLLEINITLKLIVIGKLWKNFFLANFNEMQWLNAV